MSAEFSDVPHYLDIVTDPSEQLPQTRAGISPRTMKLLQTHVPELAGVRRFPVPDDKLSWDTPFPEYNPTPVDEPYGLLTGKDADTVFDGVPDWVTSWEGRIRYDAGGDPLNPAGRTGLKGRGTMNHKGPTPAADAVILRGEDPKEVLVVVRTDNGKVALPAGKVDPGEHPLETVIRETDEETGLTFDFTKAEVIFAGVVDDDRATDNAWFETVAYRLEVTGDEAAQEPAPKFDDVEQAVWMPVDEAIARESHASTRLMLKLALENRG